MSLAQYSKEQLKELSLIELAYEFMSNSKNPIAFSDLIHEVSTAMELTEDEMRARLAQFYTDLNIDGRFLALGDNRWGLRVWYPIETAEDEVASVTKPKKKTKKKGLDEDDIDVDDYAEIEEDYDDLDDFVDDEEDLLEDEEDYDDLDDLDEFDEEEEEEVDVEVDVELDDEEEFDIDEEEELDEDLEEEDLDLDEEEDED